jgi:hypothetical protein
MASKKLLRKMCRSPFFDQSKTAVLALKNCLCITCMASKKLLRRMCRSPFSDQSKITVLALKNWLCITCMASEEHLRVREQFFTPTCVCTANAPLQELYGLEEASENVTTDQGLKDDGPSQMEARTRLFQNVDDGTHVQGQAASLGGAEPSVLFSHIHTNMVAHYKGVQNKVWLVVWVWVWVSGWAHVHLCACVCVCVRACAFACAIVCVHIYKHTHICMYVHTYTHTHKNTHT